MGCKDAVGGICCKNFPSLGDCVPDRDDSPDLNGKCWQYCTQECKGGICKKDGKSHVCHCYC
ncbi:defensin 20 [Olea europaea subsp. europaea]|nr:defensin 20 [Olea europaea subsp. europaea]